MQALLELASVKSALARLQVVPFEVAIAAIALYAGVSGLFGVAASTDALAVLLPSWALVAFQLAYIAGGLGLLWGIMRGRAAPEAFGLVTVGTSIVVRSLAMFYFLGWDQRAVSALVPNALFLAACIVRYRALGHGQTLVRTERE